jgi:molybdopterin synthase sulfur carrier subunit
MQLKIYLFGITKDIIGGNQLEIAAPPGLTVGQLRAQLCQAYPGLVALRSLAIAVNSEYAEDPQPVLPTDEVALIPPVSGG